MKDPNDSRWRAALVSVALAAAWLSSARAPALAADNPFDRHVTPILIGATLPSTAFVDQRGEKATFAAMRGQTVAVAFVYTRCTDACPVVTQKFARLDRMLGAGRYRLVEVTLDPAHDDAAVIAAYARRFDVRSPRWQILTGDPGAVATFVRAAGVSAIAGPSGDIVHNSRLLLVAPDGRLADAVELVAWDPAAVAAEMEHLAGAASSPWARADFALTKTVAQLCGGSYEVASGILDVGAGVLVFALGIAALWWLRRRIYAQGA